MNRMAINGALVLVVAGLAAALVFTQKKEEKGAPLTTLGADAVKAITIEHPGQPSMKLEKDGMLWKLVAPVQAATDPFEVATLVNLATQETRRTLPASEVKLGELKLDPPQFTVTLNDQKLEFGDVEPLEYRRYVKHGDTVALIDDPSGTSVDADYSDLVAKELLPGSAEIDKIEVPGLSVARGADGKSWAATPASAAATTDALAAFVDAWQHARAMWNARMPDDAGKGEPITLTLKDGVVNLVLVSREPQLIIDRPDLRIRYSLSKADEDKLLKLAEPPKPAESEPAKDARPAAAASSAKP
ncbi:DUF4340 domain-containing protein [Solimonas soli]|uniref:DUF4340 domain-containing protein n=1 Tax=Solimonas soli TaxID=413479 RepID=UPI00146FACCF|nr:DUF4340 domain-containing protein [Solimonas soli]